ncbi:hypothetical protein BURPSS13_W0002 [Burkholderia pseudomallei S13]|nr:hypothetical protein BURPSS13_W0002 [Burkholderia pseudomallei S13]
MDAGEERSRGARARCIACAQRSFRACRGARRRSPRGRRP